MKTHKGKDKIMVHYLTEEECDAKSAELNERQRDPAYDITLTLKKDELGWYADVPTHTRSQNAMVAGADSLCDLMAEGGTELNVRFRTVEDKSRKPLATLIRMMHSHGMGATYIVGGVSRIPFLIWLCDVTHDVTGDHPRRVYVYDVRHN